MSERVIFGVGKLTLDMAPTIIIIILEVEKALVSQRRESLLDIWRWQKGDAQRVAANSRR